MDYETKRARNRIACKYNYEKNKERFLFRTKRRKQMRRELIVKYKIGLSCIICNESDYKCLHFHHKDPSTKRKTITYLVSNGYGEETIMTEIAKCDLLCANCHRIHHVKHPIGRTTKIRWTIAYKAENPCIICGIKDPRCLDFHHRNPEEKIECIGTMVRTSKYSLEEIKQESEKCDIVCANCHAKFHQKDKKEKTVPKLGEYKGTNKRYQRNPSTTQFELAGEITH